MRDPPSLLRLAVAGTGAMARYHLVRFGSIAGVRPVSCYDRSGGRSRALAEEFSLRPCDDIHALLEPGEIDAVSVAVADSQHHEIAAAAIEKGIPVFLEKPFTENIRQAEHLVELQARYGVPVMVNFSKINYPAIRGLMVAAGAGGLGRIREMELRYQQRWLGSTVWGEWWTNPRWLWRISSSHGGGGALRDLGSHLLFLALRLGGAPAGVTVESSIRGDRSTAAGSGYSCDMNDTFSMEITFAGGAVARLQGSYVDPRWTNRVYACVTGTEGSAEVSAEREKDVLFLRRGKGGRPLRFAKVYSTYDAFVEGLRSGLPWEDFQPSAGEGLAVQKLLEGALS
ncbi:MAG: gfo/Idh/MocA family oxidoreductase [Spirochaetaceae bacterium]|nr:MAG: gfo/Idh/MocA family oxidoreductase [Spirochaetaceae bacterium]